MLSSRQGPRGIRKMSAALLFALVVAALLPGAGVPGPLHSDPHPATLKERGAEEQRIVSASLNITSYDFPVIENLDIAARKVARMVLAPGQSFSLNQTLGRRTAEAGYRKARAYAGGGNEIEELGGGLCMLSTVLYKVFLRSGLEIVERHPHQRTVGYALPGLDATINYPTKDLIVRNNTKHPVEFFVVRKGRTLSAELLGIFAANTEVKVLRSVSRALIPGRITNGFRVRTTRTFFVGGLPGRAEVVSLDVFAAVDLSREESHE